MSVYDEKPDGTIVTSQPLQPEADAERVKKILRKHLNIPEGLISIDGGPLKPTTFGEDIAKEIVQTLRPAASVERVKEIKNKLGEVFAMGFAAHTFDGRPVISPDLTEIAREIAEGGK